VFIINTITKHQNENSNGYTYNNPVPLGKYQIRWDGKNATGVKLASSVYFYSIKGEDGMLKSGKIVLLSK
jgi:hypothetical protein